MGWQLYFCIPSYKSNSLEETTAVSSWSQYDSNKEAFLVTSKQRSILVKVRHKMPTITYLEEGMGIFGYVCAYGLEEWCHVYDHGILKLKVYYNYIGISMTNFTELQEFRSLCRWGMNFLQGDAAYFVALFGRTGLLAGVHVRAQNCGCEGLRWPSRPTCQGGSPWINLPGVPQGAPYRLVNATYRCVRCHLQIFRLGRWKWMSRRRVGTVGVCYIQSVLSEVLSISHQDWTEHRVHQNPMIDHNVIMSSCSPFE